MFSLTFRARRVSGIRRCGTWFGERAVRGFHRVRFHRRHRELGLERHHRVWGARRLHRHDSDASAVDAESAITAGAGATKRGRHINNDVLAPHERLSQIRRESRLCDLPQHATFGRLPERFLRWTPARKGHETSPIGGQDRIKNGRHFRGDYVAIEEELQKLVRQVTLIDWRATRSRTRADVRYANGPR